ncbi:unnamed protein product [Prunus armeniaca]
MGSGTLRPRGALTIASSVVSFTAFGFGFQYCGCEAERILPLQLFFCFQEGEMLNETVGAKTERKSLQSVYDRDLLGTNIAPHPYILRSRPGQRPKGFQGMNPLHSP